MAREIRVAQDGDGPVAHPDVVEPGARPVVGEEPSLGELFRELAQESSMLIRQEIGLAKVEMRDNMSDFAKDAGMIAAGGGILLLSLLVFTAFLVVVLGDLLGQYWLGALIIGVVYALVGGVLLSRGRSGMKKDDLKPERTIESLQADSRWARAEAQQVKRDLTS